MNLTTLYTTTSEKLQQARIECYQFETKVLMEHLESQLSDDPNTQLEDIDLQFYFAMLEKRCAGYPLQYLIGEWDFFSLTFAVGEGVLIPRADTEILVEKVLEKIKHKKNPIVIDLCSGSGCIAIAIAKNRPDATLYAVELSDLALVYLKENIATHAPNQVQLIQADVLQNPHSELPMADVIVSNPPYIQADVVPTLEKEVKHEPVMALQGGEDGLVFYRHIAQAYHTLLKKEGLLAFEIGYDQKQSVTTILNQNGYNKITCIQDYGKHDRVVLGEK